MKIPSYLCTMKKFKTREALLQDSIDYYWGKPERRCLKQGSLNACQYSASETSLGCAIGRLIPKNIAKKLDVHNQSVDERATQNLLPDWLKAFGIPFLSDLQILHDQQYFSKRDKTATIDCMSNHVDMSKIKFPEN